MFVDFEIGVQRIFHRKSHLVTPNLLWPRLSSIPDFYTYLPWTYDGQRLWNAIWPLQPTILAGITGHWAEKQKIDWITRELGPEVGYITCKSKLRHYYCPSDSLGAILISNKDIGKQQWQEAGGIFILHNNTEDTIRQLEHILGIPLETINKHQRC